MDSMVTPWLAEIVLITWRTVRREGRPPLPSELLATFVAFGTFSVVANKQPRIAATLGWGIVIATALNLFPETMVPSGKFDKKVGGGDFPAGKTPSGFDKTVGGGDFTTTKGKVG